MYNRADIVNASDLVSASRQIEPSLGSLSTKARGDPKLSGDLLEANDRVYSWLVHQVRTSYQAIRTEADAERTLQSIQKAAAFAAAYHSGRLTDADLENAVLGIAERWLPPAEPTRRSPGPVRRILHVASQLPTIGGHTKLLAQWMSRDRCSEHSIAVTVGDAPLCESLVCLSQSSGGKVVRFGSTQTLLQRSHLLRCLASQADLVVLHHDGHDIVPVAGLADRHLPPVAIVNHADHLFWLGSSSCDLLINLRRCSSRDDLRRQARETYILPIPLGEKPAKRHRGSARRTLGVKKETVVLLAVARGVKFRPSGSFDFLGTAGKILERNRAAQLFIVGETLEGLRPYLRAPVHERIHLVGPLDDLQTYRYAADIYLETFPFGSQTALLESGLAGLPVVRAYSPLTPLLVANDDSINGLVPVPSSEDEYIQEVDRLCSDIPVRRKLGQNLQKSIVDLHTGDGWSGHLEELYAHTISLTHQLRRLEACRPDCGDDDIALAEWQAIRDGRGNWSAVNVPDDLALVRHTANIARYANQMQLARWQSLKGVFMAPFAWPSWRLFGATMLGRQTCWARRSLNKIRARHVR